MAACDRSSTHKNGRSSTPATHRALRPLEREELGDLLADEDMGEGQETERRHVDDDARDVAQRPVRESDGYLVRHGDERRLADPAEREARAGDAELTDREEATEPPEHRLRCLRAAVTACRERLELRGPYLHQRELGGDEERVHQDARDSQQQRSHS
jgi:hypothetical protein